ncbi:peptide/nickel transport system permease protein [Rhizobium leguminosarum]|uniref:Peptide/nickel transport system permease protein n=1 Tax=Rhizobium leguminosarum TaxID=384 RepID=A0AAE2MM73_RHILE|nr:MULTISPECIES: ABC transporter permease [Rhizobium]MBB4292218.1 peptide/nickel transport system permease protein [Rhizobium leguminosarum]MBB4299767.1 peptide/nickel transport system permease protein [Rhizobium leguminosarum]MBB4309844.1 peptide/nickel transport system permease protein [Rhizobium leguminosarum]MBB4419416.1 peptide/nickel transport system permease protein [Rhizobium leguminosarum]MBB4434219.1 peptide/nickel transport system permease protein [Rhizobium esperanzae]
MTSYLIFVLKRFGQFLLVVFLGVTITFFVTHLTPIDPVEESIGAITQMGQSDPNAIELMRQSLRELYGMEGSIWQQYLHFWLRLATGDLGPSLSAFPTPVSTIILRSLPWTIGLMTVSTLITFVLGNAIGALAGYYRKDMVLKAVSLVFIALLPIPYYILAFVLLIVFGYLWPVLPINGGYEMNANLDLSFALVFDILKHSILPALSLILVGAGSWLIGMQALVSNIITDDYVVFAELGGVPKRKILRSYIARNAMVPQFTGLAMSLGAIFNGTVITEIVFGYPGIGNLLIEAVHAGDYSLVLGLSALSIVGVAAAVFIIDILSPLIDPRIKVE